MGSVTSEYCGGKVAPQCYLDKSGGVSDNRGDVLGDAAMDDRGDASIFSSVGVVASEVPCVLWSAFNGFCSDMGLLEDKKADALFVHPALHFLAFPTHYHSLDVKSGYSVRIVVLQRFCWPIFQFLSPEGPSQRLQVRVPF